METTAAAAAGPGAGPSKSSFMEAFDQILEYSYWEANKHRLPDLAATAKKYLSAPCTSVESERLFSTVSNTERQAQPIDCRHSRNACLLDKKNVSLLLK